MIAKAPTMVARLVLAAVVILSTHSLLGENQEREQTVLYVAPTGDDTNTGAETAPFATIERAQQAVREAISAGLSGNVRVLIRGGVYELAKPLVFTPEDSGTEKYSIAYAAFPGEQVVVSGGRRITGWTKGDGEVWTTELPEVKESKWYFRNLYVNDRRATRARSPNANDKTPYYSLTGVSLSSDKKTCAMTLAAGQVAPWKNLADVELVIMRTWVITRKRIQSADPASAKLILMPPYIPADGQTEPRAGHRCYLENARAFLDEPSEWYLDRATGTLSYWPRTGEHMPTAEVIAPRLTSLLAIRGTAKQPVQNLHFIGIRFAHADPLLPSAGFVGVGCASGYMANSTDTGIYYRIEDAIHWEHAHSCSLEDAELAHVGGSALGIDKGCSQALVQGNCIFDVGGNGVVIGNVALAVPPAPWPTLADQPRSNQILNNFIYDCGMEYGGSAVQVAFSQQTLVAHNLIHDTALHGIGIGTSQQVPPPGIADGYSVKNNQIHHVLKTLDDGGGIYTWGYQTNGVISGNVVHDTKAYAAIYFDNQTRGYRVEQNVVYNITGRTISFAPYIAESYVVRDNFWQGTNEFVRGKTGYALSFGTDRFFDIAHQASLEPSQMTVEAWVNLRDVPRGDDPSAWVLCKNSNELTDGNYSLVVSHNNVGAYLNIGGGRENCYAAWSSSGPVSTNTWHLLAMTYDGKTLNVYCDGKLAGSSPLNRQRSTGSGPLRLGKRADGYNPSFPGLISMIHVYNRALSVEEIASRFSATSLQSPVSGPQSETAAGLVFDWNGTEVHAALKRIIENAGPQEPYRSRLLNIEPARATMPAGK